MSEKCTNISEDTFDRRLRASDLKTRTKYERCNARHSFALEGYPFYKDITLKPVSSQRKEKPC